MRLRGLRTAPSESRNRRLPASASCSASESADDSELRAGAERAEDGERVVRRHLPGDRGARLGFDDGSLWSLRPEFLGKLPRLVVVLHSNQEEFRAANNRLDAIG